MRWCALLLTVALVAGTAAADDSTAVALPQAAPDSIELFVASQCPYGLQALDFSLAYVAAHPATVLVVRHIVQRDSTAALGWTSMHGDAELREDALQKRLLDHPDAMAKYVRVRLQTRGEVPDRPDVGLAGAGWWGTADSLQTIDEEIDAVFVEDAARAELFNVTASPTARIDGEIVVGAGLMSQRLYRPTDASEVSGE